MAPARTPAQLITNIPTWKASGTAATDLHDHIQTLDARTAVSVMEYGATGNGTTDDTTAIQNAINTGRPVYFPKPTAFYKITNTLNARGSNGVDGQKIFGLDSANTTIQMNEVSAGSGVNKPIFHIGGRRKNLSGLNLSYWPRPTSSNTEAIAIKIDNLMWSVIENINIYRCGVGIAIGQNGYTGASNFCFSCSFRDIFIGNPSVHGVHLHTVNSTSTGNVFSNIYVNGFDDNGAKTSVQFGWFMEDHDSTVMDTCNIEHIECTTQVFETVNVRGLVCKALHMEGVVVKNWGCCVGSFATGRVLIEGWDIIHSQFLSGNTTKTAIAQVTNSTDLMVIGINERGNTVTAPTTILHSWDTFTGSGNASVRIINASLASITSIGTLTMNTTTDPAVRPVLKVLNHREFHPTQATLGSLSSGEPYIDTAAGNVLKIKP